ncbi:MAG: 16S rRNA (cytosine(1402)-N(4))-methyltransferase RsmH [Candidatus Auribacterota bacterium]|nr:16S rRNA (cytosine(1402)-N(4))-methyltransferase RsmH [Candidatus Auribacterota bacterium]
MGADGNNRNSIHVPVMVDEVAHYLNCRPGQVILDCTLGEGGHASLLAAKLSPGGIWIGIDRDSEAIEVARRKLKEFGGLIKIEQANFSELREVLERAGISEVDGVLFDLGVNSSQLQEANRGFSFREDGPLDMRMDTREGYRAEDLINRTGRKDLEWIIREYGEERFAGRIARRIVEERSKQPIRRTVRLARIISGAVPGRGRIHPATRTFQALRIYLNQELEALKRALPEAISILKPGGRICVISFHSLEDRIVKFEFRHQARQKEELTILTKKPVRPQREEVRRNRRSRSAKLRAAEKSGGRDNE